MLAALYPTLSVLVSYLNTNRQKELTFAMKLPLTT